MAKKLNISLSSYVLLLGSCLAGVSISEELCAAEHGAKRAVEAAAENAELPANFSDESLEQMLLVFDSGTPVDALQRLIYFLYGSGKNAGKSVVNVQQICSFYEELSRTEPFKSDVRWKLFQYENKPLFDELLYRRDGDKNYACGKGLLRQVTVSGQGSRRKVEFDLNGDLKFKNPITQIAYEVTGAEKYVCPEDANSGRFFGDPKNCRKFSVVVSSDKNQAIDLIDKFSKNKDKTSFGSAVSNRNDFKNLAEAQKTELRKNIAATEQAIGRTLDRITVNGRLPATIDSQNKSVLDKLRKTLYEYELRLGNAAGESVVASLEASNRQNLRNTISIEIPSDGAEIWVTAPDEKGNEGSTLSLKKASVVQMGDEVVALADLRHGIGGNFQRGFGGERTLEE